jgi:hypothetical protein
MVKGEMGEQKGLRERSRRKRVADVLAVGAPIAVGLSIATISVRLVVENQSQVECGSIRDFVVGFLAGALPVLELGGIVLGAAGLVLGTRLKGYAILGILLGIVVLPITAAFGFTTCY